MQITVRKRPVLFPGQTRTVRQASQTLETARGIEEVADQQTTPTP